MIDPESGRLIVASALLLAGAGFFLITAFGMFRFRLMYDRLHVATKCLTGGVLSILVGYMFIAPTPYALAKALLGSLFLLMTNAVASHALARAAYRQQCDTTGLSVDHLAEDLDRIREVE